MKHPGAVHEVLARLARRIRREWLLRGAALTAAAVAALLVASFLLDWFLDLPLAVRAVHLVLAVAAVGLVARYALVRPLRTRLDEADLAQAVEHGVPELHDRLVSALDFERRLADPSEAESRELMAGVVREAETLASRVDAGRLVDPRPARRFLLAAAVAGAALAATVIALPDEFGLWVRRGLLLADAEWPRRTTVRVLDFQEDEPRVITRGDDLRIVAVADGVRPRELELHYEEFADPLPGEEAAGPRVAFRDVRKMYPVDAEDSDGAYALDFRAVSSSFRFWVTGGDDRDRRPVHEVKAMIPPRVASFAAHVTYPDYTGLEPEVLRTPTIDVLQSSALALEFTANMPLRSARLVPDSGAPQDLPLAGSRDALRVELAAVRTQEFHLELVGEEGQTNRPEDDVFRVQVVEDRAPTARVLFPYQRLYRTPNGIVPVKVHLGDDFGIASAELEVRQGDRPVATLSLLDAAAPAERRKETSAYRPLDLAAFQGDGGAPVKAGDMLHLRVHAADAGGNRTEAPEVVVEVIALEDYERRQSQSQVALREELTQLRRQQQRTLRGVVRLRESVGSDAAGPEAFDRGRDLQVDQGRVTNELARFLSGVHRVFDGYVLNRVGGGPTVERLLPLYHEILARPAQGSTEVFLPELYARVVEEKRKGGLYDPEILGALLDIMDLGDTAWRELSPGAYEALESFSAGEDHDPRHLARAEELGMELEAKLAAIDQRMQRWEDLVEIIELARAIHREQEELSKDPASSGEEPR